MKPKAIILDVDGVLLDYVGGFLDWMCRLGHRDEDGKRPTRWDMTDCFPHLTAAHISNYMDEFSKTPFYGNLSRVPFAVDGVRVLRRKFPDRVFSAVTSAGIHPRTVSARANNIFSFDLDELRITAMGESKAYNLAQYAPGSIMVEDNAKNAKVAQSVGHRVILLNMPYNINEDSDKAYRVDGWVDVTEELLDQLAA